MIKHRCKKCLWWDNRKEFIQFLPKISDKPNPGFCRKRKAPVVARDGVYIGIHPVHDADEFCGEFDLNEEVTEWDAQQNVK